LRTSTLIPSHGASPRRRRSAATATHTPTWIVSWINSRPRLLKDNIPDKSTVIFESDILSGNEYFSRQSNTSTYHDSRQVQQVDRARGIPSTTALADPDYCDYPSTAASSTTEYSDFTASDSSNQSQSSTQSSPPEPPSGSQPAQYASATQTSLPGLHFTSTTVCPVLAAMHATASTSPARTTSHNLRCWEHNCNGRKFSTLSNLARHQREKAGDRMVYICQKCKTSFVRKSTLQDHLSRKTCSNSGLMQTGRIEVLHRAPFAIDMGR